MRIYKYKENPNLVNDVLSYYASHGTNKTKKAYPEINLRTVIEKYGRKKQLRQTKWSDEHIISLIKMAGLISIEEQAKAHNRKNVSVASIKSLYNRMGIRQNNLHGLSHHDAEVIVQNGCPYLNLKKGSRSYRFYLWMDVQDHLRTDAPEAVRVCIEMLAQFQLWLFGKNARREIKKMLNERASN